MSYLVFTVILLAVFNCNALRTLPSVSIRSRSLTTRIMASNEIKVEYQASEETLTKLNVKRWPTWGCGVSKFPWTYDDSETCLLLQGKVTVTPTDGRAPVTISKGDLCTFPAGMSCTWDVVEPILKHYNFS